MNRFVQALLLSTLFLAPSACNAFAPTPTPTPVPTATSMPTATVTPVPTGTATLTPVPLTETPTTAALVMPTGKPAKSWEGIPVMPTALAGEGDSQGYSFTVKTSADAVQAFYQTQLTKLGWNMFAGGQGSTSTVLLIFMKGSDILTISIIPQDDGLMYVLLVK